MRQAKYEIMDDVMELENVMSACGAIPRGDDLPQVAGLNDVLADIYSDALNIPHEYAFGAVFHQCDDGFDYNEMIH